jgi:hypothetical protein
MTNETIINRLEILEKKVDEIIVALNKLSQTSGLGRGGSK